MRRFAELEQIKQFQNFNQIEIHFLLKQILAILSRQKSIQTDTFYIASMLVHS